MQLTSSDWNAEEQAFPLHETSGPAATRVLSSGMVARPNGFGQAPGSATEGHMLDQVSLLGTTIKSAYFRKSL